MRCRFSFQRRLLPLFVIAAIVVGCTTDGHPASETDGPHQVELDLPVQTLLTSSMTEQPIPGWTNTVAELELPAGTVVRPIGNVGNRGVFLGITDEGWWLLGIDVSSGVRAFGPTRLGPAGDATDFNCFVNDPPMVLCVRQGPDLGEPSTAWVVDTNSGKVTYDGPTDLRVAQAQDQPRLEQIGDFAIATVRGKGVYGVGPRAELTWFVPGDGNLPTQFTTDVRDVTASELAIQGSGAHGDVVFSVIDGRVVKPDLPQGIQLGQAVVYPGGFGYEFTPADDFTTERVAFFDDRGQKLSEPTSNGTLEIGSLDLPMVRTKSSRVVLTLDGQQILQLPVSFPAAEARLIGSRLYVSVDPDHQEWQQFDVRTGEAGQTCEGDSLGPYYIASDGEVAVAMGGDGPARGVNLTTCDVLWTIPASASNEAKEVWRVHTTLIQRTNDQLFSLVAPS